MTDTTSGTDASAGAGATTPPPRLPRQVYFADRVPRRQRRTEDLLDASLATIGVALVWAFGFYAHSTTEGVVEDVRSVLATVIRQVLLLPVTLVEGLVVLVAPVAIIISLARRRRLNSIMESLLTGLVTALVGWGLLRLLDQVPPTLTAPLRITADGQSSIVLNLAIMSLAAAFSVADESANMRSVRYSWWGLWLITLLGVVRGAMTLPGALVSVLIGRALGSLARWLLGFEDRRARGVDIVEGLLSIGIVPSRIIRTDLETHEEPLSTFAITEVGEDEGDPTPSQAGPQDVAVSPVARPLRQVGTDADLVEYTVNRRPEVDSSRRYQAWDDTGTPLEIMVVDPGKEITGTMVDVWNNLRLRGISRWISPSIKANAERAMLTSLSAMRAGVHVPEPLGLAQAGDSLLVVHRGLPPTTTLQDAPAEALTDAVLDQAWRQLARAHSRAISHRDLGFDAVVLDAAGTVWLMDWERGEVATTELNRRIDIAQMLVHLAVCVGADRALASARRVVGGAALRSSAPALQRAVLPSDVNAAVRRTDLVTDLRNAIVDDSPTGSVQMLNLQRFAPRTVIMVGIGMVALVVVLGTMNFQDILRAVTEANPVWIAVAFLLASLTWVGGAVPLVAFSTEKVRLRDAVLAQIAASIVTVVAPAGIGPAALNLRFLNKQKVPTAMAATTVTLMQISQFLTTILLLLIIILTSGSPLGVSLPYTAILAVAAVLVIVVVALVATPRLRTWIWQKVQPTWVQVYPRVLWLVGQPRRILAVLGGNLLMNVGFIGSFAASLAAFGGRLDLMALSVTYLASNSLGSVVPSPGGIGPVEAALTGGLQVAGVPLSIALSTAVVYRLVTFYGRIPFGWVAMKVMQKRDLL